jgi:hypothetical protein
MHSNDVKIGTANLAEVCHGRSIGSGFGSGSSARFWIVASAVQASSTTLEQECFRLVPEPDQQLLIAQIRKIHPVRNLGFVLEHAAFRSGHLDRIVHDFAAVKIVLRTIKPLLYRSPA